MPGITLYPGASEVLWYSEAPILDLVILRHLPYPVLDELALTTTGFSPQYVWLMLSVEALAGPQGTLYGSDAQAGHFES